MNHFFCRNLSISTLALLLLQSLLLSCGASSANKHANNDSLPAAISIQNVGAISAAEKKRLHDGCKLWYDSTLLSKGFNGGIIVAKKGNIVFEGYHGTGHVNGNDTITENTPFHIASVSKTFTAMAVLKLWQQNKVSIDDEFSKYFPLFNYPGVTIRTLLNHRSGLPNYVYFMEQLGWDKTKLIHNQNVLDFMVNKKAILTNIAPPNHHFTYCNTNYALLALLIEKISGQSYSQFIQQNIFTPLQMKNSFVFDSSMIGKVNISYDWRGRDMPFNFLDGVYGDKNIYTTPQDLLKWERAISSSNMFTEKTLEQAYAPYSNEKPGIRNYGLGWRMFNYPDGKKIIYHNGWWHGNSASFVRLLKDSATIIVVSNKFNRGVYHAKDMAALFGNYDAGGEEEEGESARATYTTTIVTAAPKKAGVKKKKKK